METSHESDGGGSRLRLAERIAAPSSPNPLSIDRKHVARWLDGIWENQDKAFSRLLPEMASVAGKRRAGPQGRLALLAAGSRSA
jgi:hypothetical protein